MLNSSIIDYSVPDHHPHGSSMMVIASQWFPGGGATDIALRSLKAVPCRIRWSGIPMFWHSKMPTGTLRIKYMTNGHQSWMFWLYFLQFRHIQTISQQLDFRCKSVPCDSFGRLPPALMERARSLVSGCIASTDIDFNCSNHRYNVYPMRPQLCDIR